MTKPSDTPSLMDDGEFLAELEQIDRQSPVAHGEDVDRMVAPRDVADPHAAAAEYIGPAAAAADDDSLDADLFVPSAVQPGTAVFPDENEPEYEPLPPMAQEAGSLVPVVLIGMAVGGGAAAFVFHERLVRLLFGG